MSNGIQKTGDGELGCTILIVIAFILWLSWFTGRAIDKLEKRIEALESQKAVEP